MANDTGSKTPAGSNAAPAAAGKAGLLGSGEVASLDGLRALSVLIVMVSHTGLGWIVPGGFGVTMFFFISGFIITTLLIREQVKRGHIAIRDFYLRRALRLYPALFVFVAVIVAVYAAMAMMPKTLGILGGFFYFMNYLVIFAPANVLPQANHLWSLAVEAHFYLLYPWLFIWLAPNLRRLAIALALVCAGSLLVRVGAAAFMTNPAVVYEYAYQASEARLDSIAFGALCAALLLSPTGAAFAQRLTHPIAVTTGLGLLALTLVIRNPLFRDTLRYSLQGLALMPVVLAAVLGSRSSPVIALLNARWPILVGWLSYSLYLWHPAAFEFGKYLTGTQVPGLMLGWIFAIAAAWLSFNFIEKPMLAIRSRFGSEIRPSVAGHTSVNETPTPNPSTTTIHAAQLEQAANDNKDLPMTRTAQSRENNAAVTPIAHVDGWPLHLANAADSLATLTGAAKRGEGFLFAPLNLDLLVKLRSDTVFAAAMRRATYVIADGWPIAALGRRENPRVERTTGADLVVPLCQGCAENGLPIYLFGTSPEVLAEVSAELTRQCPGLRVAGMESPQLGFDPRSPTADAAIARIKSSGARLCFLALGAPKQEIFGARALDQGAMTGFVCVGAGLDFIAGAQVRAPAFMRDNGMEWLWRLLTNPRRLAARYAQCAVLLADIVLVEPGRRWLARRA